MSDRQYKWKQVGKTAQRLNSMLSAKKELPTRFAPNKDRSESVDKLFNNSRSRLHDSMEMAALNNTREEQNLNKITLSRIESQMKRDEQIERRSSNNKMTALPTLILAQHQSTGNEAGTHSSFRNGQQIADLKKQFWAFKQNVLHELQRQKEMVQKFMKEIVLTMEIQIQKIGKISENDITSIIQKQENKNNEIKTKTIEEWKNKLQTVRIAPSSPPLPKSGNPIKIQSLPSFKAPLNELKRQQSKFQPPKIQIQLLTFLNSIQNLKRQFNEMDSMFQNDKQPTLQPRISQTSNLSLMSPKRR